MENLNRDTTELVMYSGPIGYNRQHGVAKARQFQPMKYTDTYLDLEPGRIIEKNFIWICIRFQSVERLFNIRSIHL